MWEGYVADAMDEKWIVARVEQAVESKGNPDGPESEPPESESKCAISSSIIQRGSKIRSALLDDRPLSRERRAVQHCLSTSQGLTDELALLWSIDQH